MRVVTRHRPPDPASFIEWAEAALRALSVLPGFRSGELGRSPDDPSVLLLTTSWADVGSMRRGLGSYAAKIALAPVMASAADEPSAFEVLLEVAGGKLTSHPSARSPGDAERAF